MTRSGPSRRTTVLAAVVLGAAAVALGSTVWATAWASTPLAAQVQVAVTGRAAAPGVAAGGVVALAAGVALALAGRWTTPVAGGALAAGGLLEAVAAVAALRDMADAAARTAQETLGVDVLGAGPALTAAPWAAVAVGVMTAALGVVAATSGHRWAAARRHVSPTDPDHRGRAAHDPAVDDQGVQDEQGAWDALSRGEDPT